MQDSLPKASIIGVTRAGAIWEGKVIDEGSVISFSIFENTKVKAITLATNGKNVYELGKEVASQIIEPDTQAIITFIDFLSVDCSNYLRELSL